MSRRYAGAGVDVRKVRATHSSIGRLVRETYRFRAGRFAEVQGRFGHYASLINIGYGKALALHADGCGTKVLVAQLMNRFDTIGIDCVAMNVNDLICMGAEPVALIDYLAVERIDGKMIDEIMKGLVKGAELAGVAITGGETAVMPDVIKGAVEGKGFDLAALSVGTVDLDRIVSGDKMKVGNIVVGFESSGVHSNGLTLARKVLFKEAGLKVFDRPEGFDRTIGEELLTPTRIYVKEVLEALSNVEVHAVAHITGGGYSKLNRFRNYAKVGFQLDAMPKPQKIFRLIQRLGKIPVKEMYQTFNMGVGMCLVTLPEFSDEVISIAEKHGSRAFSIGKICRGSGVRIKIAGTKTFSI